MAAVPRTSRDPLVQPRPRDVGFSFWPWFLQRVTGAALVVLLFVHLWVNHIVGIDEVEAGVYEDLVLFSLVADRLDEVIWWVVDVPLLAFTLSFDDFVITYFNAGGTQTFPVFVWGIARVAVPPQVNVVASAIFLVAIAIALASVLWQIARAGRNREGAA